MSSTDERALLRQLERIAKTLDDLVKEIREIRRESAARR